MSDLRTAAQQALEALEWCEPAGTVGRGGIEARKQAIAALRAALAQQDEPVQEPAFHGFMSDDGTQVDVCFSPSAPRSDGTYATAYYTAPPHRVAQQAEPAQEPVAWMFELARNFNLEGYGGWEKRITEYRPNTPEGSVRNVTPLYTSPPQRKPLTEEEIYRATGHCGVSKYAAINITRAVERAHGIKE